MSNQIKVTGYLHARQAIDYHSGGTKTEFSMLPYVSRDPDVWGACLGAVEFTHTLPDGFDIKSELVRAAVAALEAEKREVAAEFARKTAAINKKLSELQAITHEPEAA